MNISRSEQRSLHVLARGGAIAVEKDDRGKIIAINCITREGWSLTDCTMETFQKLRKKRLIASKKGAPYRITLKGRRAVRPQLDNRA
ncbi:MAG: YjhX family toxin [Pseudomonadota bacterium]